MEGVWTETLTLRILSTEEHSKGDGVVEQLPVASTSRFVLETAEPVMAPVVTS